MFKNLKRKFKEFINKRHRNEPPKIIINNQPDKKLENILNYETSDNLIKLQILNECTFKEYVDAIDKYENKENSVEIPIRMFITSGGDIINTKLKKQKMFIVSRGNVKYSIVTSRDEVKLSEKIYQGEEIDEITLNINKNSKAYTIAKYIHDLNHSTKFLKWYPIQDEAFNAFALTKLQAIELFKVFLQNLEKIKDMKIFLEMENLYDLVSLIGNMILSDDTEEKLNNSADDSKPSPDICDSQVDSTEFIGETKKL